MKEATRAVHPHLPHSFTHRAMSVAGVRPAYAGLNLVAVSAIKPVPLPATGSAGIFDQHHCRGVVQVRSQSSENRPLTRLGPRPLKTPRGNGWVPDAFSLATEQFRAAVSILSIERTDHLRVGSRRSLRGCMRPSILKVVRGFKRLTGVLVKPGRQRFGSGPH